ncbi:MULTISPECIES: 4Fe-4S binding protein [Gordonibacter]|uniref:Oxidoreductase n=1 Tax=Gordonibacter urolithinfaciens TaxID=1335613 RepID=A0A423UK11_9ACTN|nr:MULTISPECIES: 4Fe-4S binding protein [Gordonibacter]MBS6975765.1 4Fe-4S binding protein [Eggerthellaceae bacterium]MCB6561227.1 4Fe-4S binding protein [Gordonibacter urolithinfaciens]MCB7084469.1 4Fe-4S binding protein [Gordonibacter urolithinfaciens]MDN4470484.1 4Fe-4S binding protein [Gordonibacter sp. RACS_AR68]MDN4509498.1 4Fe-4S binding protein [Gordonibacter sp. RACS_AR49]
MTEYGMLIDYEWCTGCHSCETACQMEHHLPVGQFGIKLNEIGPFEYAPDRWQLSYVPVPTDLCDFCAERQAKGKLPTCQHHCQAQCLEVGPIDELAKKIASKKKLVLFNI